MLFHEVSAKLYTWLEKQPNVKEESLTDWLLFELSEREKRIKYFAFSRNEEATIGADWDWWVLTDHAAYRFRVQAKKIRPNADNWSSISYSNRNGTQIDLLLESAKQESAFPLYMLYSSSAPNVSEQLRTYQNDILHKMIQWCENCSSGGFLSPAKNVFNAVFGSEKKIISDEVLLNISLKFPSLDYFFNNQHSMKAISEYLELLNSRCIAGSLSYLNESFRFEYEIPQNNKNVWRNNNRQTIPHWLHAIIKEERQFDESSIPEWFEREFKRQLPDIQGFVTIDLRC